MRILVGGFCYEDLVMRILLEDLVKNLVLRRRILLGGSFMRILF